MRKLLLCILTVIFAGFFGLGALEITGSTVSAAARLQDTGDKIVIVIDPGHGGENLGTIENNHEEKSMTMTTALAMYEELLLYEDVEVYLTRTDDRDLSLKERAQFAAEVDADFLFSIHYNASENHELFGSEVWVSAFPPYNGYGYQFGYEYLTDMRELGLLVRGVKTRLGDSGNDYYGIIRQSVALDIPAVIIEHCHVDEEHDTGFCDTEEELKAFGIADATAVAKYFGLKSSILNVDYSDYKLVESSTVSNIPITLKDATEPDMCQITLEYADYEACRLSLKISAADYDSPLLYYSYSLDGGKTFTIREPWPDSDTLTGSYTDTFTLTLDIPSGTKPQVILRAYNMFDLYTESNIYQSTQSFLFPIPSSDSIAQEPSLNILPVVNEDALSTVDAYGIDNLSLSDFLKICLVFAIITLSLIIIIQSIAYSNRKKRRRQRRNEAGRNRDQHR